jgi:hypothetical protein
MKWATAAFTPLEITKHLRKRVPGLFMEDLAFQNENETQ